MLGVLFDCDVSWNSHASKLKQRAAMTMRKLRFLGRFIGQQGKKKVITTHLFGMLYYASVVWLNELTTVKIISIYYKGLLRITAKDYFTTLSRQRPDDIFNRATPSKWMQYSNAKQLELRLPMPAKIFVTFIKFSVFDEASFFWNWNSSWFFR